jgi:hypothetical protein
MVIIISSTMYMPIFELDVLEQSCTLVKAIEALDTIETCDEFERQVAGMFQAAFVRRVGEIADNVSEWDIERILAASV